MTKIKAPKAKKQPKQTKLGSQFFNARLYVEALKRLRVIGLAVAILALTVAILAPTICWISESNSAHYEEYYDEFYGEWIPVEIEPEPEKVGLYLLCLPLYGIPFAAPLFFLVLYSFLHKRKQSDFYHAIPYTRTCVYVSFTTAALSFVLAIQIACALCSGILYAFCPYTTFAFSELVSLTAISFLSAALLSSFMMLALAVTGTGATTSILFVLFAAIVRAILGLFALMIDSNLRIVQPDYYPFLSPLWFLPFRMFVPAQYASNAFERPPYAAVIPYTIVVTLAVFALAGLFYKLRRSEMAERSAPSRRLQDVFRCLFTLPFALLLTALIVAEDIEFELALILFAVILLAFYLYELITTKRIRNMTKATPWLGVVLAGALVFAGSFGIFSAVVQKPIPEEKIDSVVVELETGSTFEALNTSALRTDDETIIALVSDGIEAALRAADRGTRKLDVTIYKKNGVKVQRYVPFTDKGVETVRAVCAESEEYKNSYLEIPAVDELRSIGFSAEGTSHYLGEHLSGDKELRELWAILEKEYATLSEADKFAFKRATNDEMVTEGYDAKDESYYGKKDGQFRINLSVNGTKNGVYYSSDYYIPAAMQETITYLIGYMENARNTYYYDGTYHYETHAYSEKDPYTAKEVLAILFEDLAAGATEFEHGSVEFTGYGKKGLSVISFPTANADEYAEVYSLLCSCLDEKRTATEESFPLVLSCDVGGERYAYGATIIYVTPSEYETLVDALDTAKAAAQK